MKRRNILKLMALALIAAPEPFTTVTGVALLCLSLAFPNNQYRMAPCSGVIIRRGTLPRR